MASPLITDITVDNCVPLFLFSTITNLFAFAKPKNQSDLLVAENDSVPDWLYLFRGVRALMDAQGDLIHQSFVAPLFEQGTKMHKYWQSHKFENVPFTELEANVQVETDRDADQLASLLSAIDVLQRSFALHYAADQPDENRTRGVMIWLSKVSNGCISMVAEGDNAASCVLAFFCVLLKRLDFQWWMEGWGIHLIERIYSRLDEMYKLWVRWPMEEIGWVPSS